MISAVDQRRLNDGFVALSLPEPKTFDEVLDQMPILHDGIAALQSLDDLGETLNKAAWANMETLEAKFYRLKKQQRETMGKSKTQGDIVETDKMFLFWSGWPSQWFKGDFKASSYVNAKLDGGRQQGLPDLTEAVYNCAEQYMMAEKARLFGDTESLKTIMNASNPREQKALGRKVKNFDAQKWDQVCRDIVYYGNLARFTHSNEMRKLLLDTGDKTLVEASPKDKIWGIGLAPDDARALDPEQWQGKNWLGEALTRVRRVLQVTTGV